VGKSKKQIFRERSQKKKSSKESLSSKLQNNRRI